MKSIIQISQSYALIISFLLAACCSQRTQTGSLSMDENSPPKISATPASPVSTPTRQTSAPLVDPSIPDAKGRLCGYVPPAERCNLEVDEGKPCAKEHEHCGDDANSWGYDALICTNGRLVRYHEENFPEFARRRDKEKELCSTASANAPCEGEWSCRPNGKDCGACESCEFLKCEEGVWKQMSQPADPNMCETCRK